MIKISLCLLAVYLMYYAGNIIYDLFLKKEKGNDKEETEEFSLSEISGQYQDVAKTIGIEDVENLNTPKSFSKKELIPTFSEDPEENLSLEELRIRFESEQDMDDFDREEETVETKTEQTEAPASKNEEDSPNQPSGEPASSIQQSNKNKWHQMLNLAETNVQMISHNDGYKIYQSIM